MLKTIYKTLSLMVAATMSATAADKPNILFICVDDLKPTLGSYGDKYAITPNIDKLAAQGVVFTNAHANQAVCGPSRCSVFSSLRPDRTKVHDLKTDFLGVSPWVVTLPEHLKKHGYSTAGSGKLFHGGKSDGALEKRAWDLTTDADSLPYADGFSPPALHYQGPAQQELFKSLREKNKQTLRYGQMVKALKSNQLNPSTECLDIPDAAYADGALALETLKYIDTLRKNESPFFVAVGFKKPHLPFAAPKKYWDMYKRKEVPMPKYTKAPSGAPAYALSSWGELRNYADIPAEGDLAETKQRELVHGYYACTSYTDAQIGVLLDGLRERGLKENTIIVLWGDHGWHLGDHGIWCKHSNYEQATRTPLIFSGPGVISSHQTDSPTELIDIFPTLCGLAGVEMIANTDGIDLTPILQGQEKELRDVAISSYPRWKGMGYTMRDKRYRYTVWVDNKEPMIPFTTLRDVMDEELYDYDTDPLETKNLAKDPSQSERMESFRKRMDQHLREQARKIAAQSN